MVDSQVQNNERGVASYPSSGNRRKGEVTGGKGV